MVLLTARRNGKNGMIDLHCHILPGIDDGAKDLQEARMMISMLRSSGTAGAFLTPHFYPEEKSIETFLAERAGAWEKLCASLDPQETVQLRLGAEVRYCEQLLSLDLRQLTMGESDYLLLELPGRRYPAYLSRYVDELLGKGIVPILAHVERFNYFREDPQLLKQLIDLGALAQVSAQTLCDKRDKKFSIACLSHGLAQIVASDAHNSTDRKPCMEQVQKLPDDLRQLHDSITSAVWDNELPPYIRATTIKKTFFGYR